MMKFNRQHRNPPVRHPLVNEVSDGRYGDRAHKAQLRSTWTVVEGRLVCQWITVPE